MNSKIKSGIVITAIAAFVTVAGTFAQGEESGGGGRLAGTWDAVVTVRPNCDATSFTINSIASFNLGGTSVGSTAGIPQSLRTPEHGVWRHEKGNTYRFKFKSFSFLPTGAPNGWTIVEHVVELSQDNNSYTSSGTAKFFAPNGAQVGQGCSSAVGTRFEL